MHSQRLQRVGVIFLGGRNLEVSEKEVKRQSRRGNKRCDLFAVSDQFSYDVRIARKTTKSLSQSEGLHKRNWTPIDLNGGEVFNS